MAFLDLGNRKIKNKIKNSKNKVTTRHGDTCLQLQQLGGLRQENCHEFETSRGYTATSCLKKTKPNKQLVASNLASSPTWSFYHKANDLFGRFHNRSPNLETALVLGVPRKTTLPVPGRLTFIQLLNQMVLGSQSLEDTLACLPITLLREIPNIFQSKGQQIKVNLNYTEKPSQNQEAF